MLPVVSLSSSWRPSEWRFITLRVSCSRFLFVQVIKVCTAGAGFCLEKSASSSDGCLHL